MMFRNQILLESPLVLSSGVVAGSTAITNLSGVDCLGFEGIQFWVLLGTLTATQVTSIKAQQSSDDGSTDGYSDIEGSLTGPAADADGGKLLILDIYRPKKRYVKLYINRATANAVIGAAWAVRYLPSFGPTTNTASISAVKHLGNPSEGTA